MLCTTHLTMIPSGDYVVGCVWVSDGNVDGDTVLDSDLSDLPGEAISEEDAGTARDPEPSLPQAVAGDDEGN